MLDWDLESVASGYGDPEWVSSTVVAWAYCWVGSDNIQSATLPVRHWKDDGARRAFLQPLVDTISSADVQCGHNLYRFDCSLLQSQLMLLNMQLLPPLLVEDTMWLPKARGFRKGQDNIGTVLGLDDKQGKLAMHWAAWERGFAHPTLEPVRDRVVADVRQHMLIREEARRRGWLKPPRMWRP